MESGDLSFSQIFIVLIGTIMGIVARLFTLKVDKHQNPTVPNGYFINIVMAVVASFLGAIFVPALMSKDLSSVTFLTLAIEQFRTVRNLERESLTQLDKSEIVPRGGSYIDGIAKTYEARNYHSIITALIVVIVYQIIKPIDYIQTATLGILTGSAVMLVLHFITKGKKISDVCNIKQGKITFKDNMLFLDDVYVASKIATVHAQDCIKNEGIGMILTPKHAKYRLLIESVGQQQAVMYEIARALGIKQYYYFRTDPFVGAMVLVFIPIIRRTDRIVEIIGSTPVLENSVEINKFILGAPNDKFNNDIGLQ